MQLFLRSECPQMAMSMSFDPASKFTVIGRQGARVPSLHPGLSREHAEVACVEGAWMLRDLGSTNGTRVNGIGIGQEWVSLADGDVLVLGRALTFTVCIENVPEMGRF